MKRIVFATSNQGKMDEIRMILADLDAELLSLKEAGIHADIVEDGETFEENALIKARAICKMTGEMVLADDSGLEVDYLGGAPGVYSARYLGEDTPYSVKNKYIIEQLKDAVGKERSARFVCAIAAVFPDGREIVTRGTVEGLIGYEEKGIHGFGYDPIVYVPEFGMTTGEMEPEKKNDISHRGKALRQMRELIKECLE
ncbi:MAG: XTP/dITP diphosphatase [Lachnospiraceae bacterium]|nr:XTP/dITP diphosphatase [Lachnospiraceae bacterium]